MRNHLSCLLFFSALVFFSGCIDDHDSSGMEAAPREAFESWLQIIETGDFAGMWDKLSLTGKERFSYAWEDEKENLTKSSAEFKEGFIKRYGFSSFDEVLNEDAGSFFVRSMKVNDDGKFPQKYSVLKESTIDNFEFLNNGNACILTFKDSKGNFLPLKMKLQKEGEDWTVIRMP
jgi:hypothetical protein